MLEREAETLDRCMTELLIQEAVAFFFCHHLYFLPSINLKLQLCIALFTKLMLPSFK